MAREVLDADPALLESTTRKIRSACFLELEVVAVNGCMRVDGRLRASLLLAASLIKLDIQELEGLNSMVKVAVARSQNNRITLDLLTSRVCTRKLVALHTAGATKYKAIVPAAAALARSAFLYHGQHREILDDVTRWEACSEASFIPGDPSVYNPALKHSGDQLWAVKYNTQVMKRLRAHEKSDSCIKDSVFALLLPQGALVAEDLGDGGSWAIWLCCAVTRSQAMFIKASRMPDGKVIVDQSETEFVLSVDLLASQYSRVQEAAAGSSSKRLTVYTQALRILHDPANPDQATHFALQEETPSVVCVLRDRYQRSTQSHISTPVAAVTDNASESDDEAEQNQVGGTLGMNPDSLMRMLHGMDDFSDVEGDILDDNMSDAATGDVTQDLLELEELNVRMAAGVANQQSDSDSQRIRDTVARNTSASDAAMSTLSPVEEETEAFLQELLLQKIHTTGDILQEDTQPMTQDIPKGLDKPECASVIPAEFNRFHHHWQSSFLESCQALEYRAATATRTIGENSASV